MPSILIIEKLGNIKPLSIKTIHEDELYKKAGFKVANDFKCHTIWNVELNNTQYSIHLYGKTTGRATQENKYEFPPPVDNALFFGNCLLISKTKDTIVDLTIKIWGAIYEHLFGGFEDLGDNDTEDDETSDEDVPKTKSGYEKDGFIVEDDDTNSSGENTSEDEIVIPAKKNRKTTSSKKSGKPVEVELVVEELDYLDCKSELSEESYIE